MSSENCKFHIKGHCRAKSSCNSNHDIKICPQNQFCNQRASCELRHVKICQKIPNCGFETTKGVFIFFKNCSYYHPTQPPPNTSPHHYPHPPLRAPYLPHPHHPPPNLLYNLLILPTRPAPPPPIPQTTTHPGWGEPGMDTEKNCLPPPPLFPGEFGSLPGVNKRTTVKLTTQHSSKDAPVV